MSVRMFFAGPDSETTVQATSNKRKRALEDYDIEELRAHCTQLQKENQALHKRPKPTPLFKPSALLARMIRTVCTKLEERAHTLNKVFITRTKKIQARNAQNRRAYAAAKAAPRTFEYEESPGWTTITNSSITSALSDLFNGKRQTVTYTTGAHEYKARKRTDGTFVQINTSHPAHTKRRLREHPLPDPPTDSPLPAPWEIDLLTNTGIQGFGQQWALNALQAYSFQNDTLETVVGASVIAKLATLFSSFSQGFRYDVTKCELWVRPAMLQAWLTRASKPGYTSVRLVMHGSKSYDAIREDPLCFEMNQSKVSNNREGAGIYAGLTDIPPTFYNRGSGLPEGSGILALVLMPDSVKGHSKQYPLGWNLGNGKFKGHEVKDALVVRDVTCILPLGLAVATDEMNDEEDDDDDDDDDDGT